MFKTICALLQRKSAKPETNYTINLSVPEFPISKKKPTVKKAITRKPATKKIVKKVATKKIVSKKK
jgi:hypothetical protein